MNYKETKTYNYVMKEMNLRWAFLKGHCDCTIMAMIHQGSFNHGLEIMNEEYLSDIDVKVIAIPSLENLLNGNKGRIYQKLEYVDGSFIEIRDVRDVFDLFKKQNIQYLELLFSNYYLVNSSYKNYFNELRQISGEISTINEAKLVNCHLGMAKEKRHALEKVYPATQEKIEKYGYDGKQLHHIARLYFTLEKYLENGKNYGIALHVTENKGLLDVFKLNKVSLDSAIVYADMFIDKLEKLVKEYEPSAPNDYGIDFLNNLEKKIITTNIKKEILGEQ